MLQRVCSTALGRPTRLQGRSAGSVAGMTRVIKGVVFDMDGTVTVPVIDFADMRRRVGVVHGDILDYIGRLSPSEQQRAHDVIAEIEDQALADMRVMPGALELARLLDDARVPRGLITRNVRRSVSHFHQHHWPAAPFEPAITRECDFPYKPSPEALLHIVQRWGISPGECMMVGDSARDDIASGNRAGAVTVLLDSEGRYTSDGLLAATPEAAEAEAAERLGQAAVDAAEGRSVGSAESIVRRARAAAEAVQGLEGEQRPHFLVRSLTELRHLLQHEFALVGRQVGQP